MTGKPLIYCAIDTADKKRALELASAMQSAGAGIKLGLEFYNHFGPAGIKEIRDKYPKSSIFLDLKFHDIPNTVYGAVKAVTSLGVDYINLHASGGSEMMKAALEASKEAASDAGITPPQILAVTILTSLDDQALNDLGYRSGTADSVMRLATLTKEAGLAGIVCSALEIQKIRSIIGQNYVLMVPGIRPAGEALGDQKRVMTPQEAVNAGATHLVIGRPITGAADPSQAVKDIMATIEPKS